MSEKPKKVVHLRDVAAQAGVSVATVSMALSNHPNLSAKTKQRVRQISRQMGYKRRTTRGGGDSAKSSAKAAANRRFGFLLLGSRMDNEVHLGELQALTAAAAAAGNRMEVMAVQEVGDHHQTVDQTLRYAASLHGLVVSGLIDIQLLHELETAGVPHVVMGHVMAEPHELRETHSLLVATDPVAMGELATRELLARGHTRIAFVCERLPRGLFNDRWLRGYRIALADHRLEIDADLISVPGKSFADPGPIVEKLLDLKAPPTGYVAPDVRTAAGLRDALAQRGRPVQPQDMIVGGHQHLLTRFGMGDFTWIGDNPGRLASMAIRQLHHACEQPMPCNGVIVVPFDTHNLAIHGP